MLLSSAGKLTGLFYWLLSASDALDSGLNGLDAPKTAVCQLNDRPALNSPECICQARTAAERKQSKAKSEAPGPTLRGRLITESRLASRDELSIPLAKTSRECRKFTRRAELCLTNTDSQNA